MSQPGPFPRRSRRRRGLLLGGALLLLAGIVLAIVFRTEIATRFAVAWLESRGIAVQSLEVAALATDRVELRDLVLGERRELTAGRVVLTPRIEDFAVELDAAHIDGLRLALDATGRGPPLGSLQPALEALIAGDGSGSDSAGSGGGSLPVLPRIVIEDSTLLIETRAGPQAATLAGELAAEGGALTLRLPGEAERIDLTISARRAGEEIALALAGELRTAGELARLLALPGPEVTAGTLVIEAAGRLDPARRALTLRGDAVFGGVRLADGSEGLSAHLPLTAEITDARAIITLDDDAAVRVERPSADSLRALGVPRDLLPLLASGLTLTLASGGEVPFRLAATPPWPPRQAEIAGAARAASDQGLRLAVSAAGDARFTDSPALAGFVGSVDLAAEARQLAVGGREVRAVALGLPLTADYGDAGVSLALARPGTLRIAGFGAGTPLQIETPLAVTIDALALSARAGVAGYRYRLSAREDGATFTVAAAEPIAVTAGAVTLTLDGSFEQQRGHDASLTTRLGGLALPGYGFAAEAAEITVVLDKELRPAESRFALGPFRLAGAEPLTAPLALDGRLQRAGAGYDVAGTLSLAGGQALADLSGRYRDDGRASLEAASRLLAFAPDGLQPADLSPALAGLTEVRGNVSADARLAWPRAPAGESGRLTLANLSFTSGAAEVEGLDLALELDSLLPLASAAGQRLTVRSLEAGVPVEEIELIFSLDQAPHPQLTVEDGRFALGGARWRIAPTVLDPAAAHNRVVLSTDALDLATFFRLIGVDGLSGTGTLTGSLPVAFAGGDVILEDGSFDALGSGRLSIRIPALRQALSGSGETVEAAVRALEDFHYEELSLSVAKTAANDATVRLSTLGQNPEVMDGQPFRFNINLESNLTSVLDALRQGYSLSDEALRRAWRLRD